MENVEKKKKEKVEFNPSVHGDRLQQLIVEASNLKIQQEKYGEMVKEQKDIAKRECGVEGKLFNQLLRIYHRQEREQFEDAADEVTSAYDQIFKGN
ncbi:dsbA [Aeromonas phage 31]|uniref:DsDNA binding protein n=4 Tax=Biquartavirus TaxID=1912143 RepID=Q6U985_9CAUD|nr:transcriptional regulator [Aeromonas phage 44RR2.8t]YP_238943.1 transcriptional regulator [Aeromonas phage 31]APU00689.1 double-stranded DNA binding protein [Aeromonas phage 44RR2.8t.2]APU01108.1 double-stranded DNA binding protein [Aeromonas phage 31.2]APU02018.1 double-stranded DNA binding protein [Aeromonas phage L9-6]APU02269.1 double-stranded DNA binding protein [Aeromonas phage Riv-10]APU02517.1 double-stranded DNA binding protein [Aeromonas phage SW69-9]UYD59770.1 double-stranded D